MTVMLKDPEAALEYAVDWGADYLFDDMLLDSSWTVTPDEPGGVSVVSSSFGPKIATVKAGGGIAGHVYRLTNRVVLSSGMSDDRSIVLRVEER